MAQREASGSYKLEMGGRVVIVFRSDETEGSAKWNWRDENDRYACGDPVMTKRQALADATSYATHRGANPEEWK